MDKEGGSSINYIFIKPDLSLNAGFSPSIDKIPLNKGYC